MKKILLLIITIGSLFADDIIVFNNEYKVLKLDKKVNKLLIGNKAMVNVSLLSSSKNGTVLKIFGKKSGNTSILIKYRDATIENFHVYVNQNLGFIQKMINMIEPSLELSKVGDGSTVIQGTFKDPHNKKRIYSILKSAGVNLKTLMDLTKTTHVNKMVRTKLYLVEINNQRAKDLGGVTGLGFFDDYLNVGVNPVSSNSATFSGWLLDNTGKFSTQKGTSVTSTLNFLQSKGIGKILDDTVLMTTEDKNASFRVGGDVYIPVGMTQNVGFAPTIQLEEKQYGLLLKLNSKFMEKDNFVHINVDIEDSAFDTNKDHDVQLGEFIVVPSFLSKNIKTNVVVKSGQVIVLGGRLHTENVDKEEKVPFLGDIPLIGELFKHTVTQNNANDLLFFLVPEVVDANEKIDNTHYYRDFKKDSAKFHKEMMDMNETEKIDKSNNLVVLTPDITKDVKEETVPIIEEEKSDENMSDSNSSHASESIVVIDPKPINTNDDVYTIVSNDTIPQEIVTPKEELVTPVDDVNRSVVNAEVNQTKTLAPSTKIEATYEVLPQKVFLRSAPVDGKRVKVWIKGHKFTVSKEEKINNQTWMQIKDNCYKECTKATQELWIAKGVTKSI